MKIRSGFVSNSSSSSFIINAETYSLDKIVQVIDKLVEVHNLLEDENMSASEICTIRECEDGGEQFWKDVIAHEAYTPENVPYILTLRDMVKEKKVVVIDSTNDNSIPWFIQSALEDIAIKRQHWG